MSRSIKNSIIFSGTSNLSLAEKVSRKLKVKLGKIDIEEFSDGETYVNIKENIFGKNVFILQSGSAPANDNLVELLLIIDAVKRLKPKKIIAIIPFYPYRRQERKLESGEPISAQLVAKLLEIAGINKVMLCDIHSEKILKFFKIPVVHVNILPFFEEYFKKKKIKDFIVVAPDQGIVSDNRKLAKVLGSKITFIKKSRERKHDVVEKIKLVGDVKYKNIIMFDDEINTGETIVEAVKLLKKHGAKDIYVACTHAVLSGPAISRIKKSPIKEVVVTDTIYLLKKKRIKKIKVLSVTEVLADKIKSLRQV